MRMFGRVKCEVDFHFYFMDGAVKGSLNVNFPLRLLYSDKAVFH